MRKTRSMINLYFIIYIQNIVINLFIMQFPDHFQQERSARSFIGKMSKNPIEKSDGPDIFS